jgi:hypothetical protein
MISVVSASVHMALAGAVGSSGSVKAMSQSLYGDKGALTRSGAVAMVFSLGARIRTNDVVRCGQELSFADEGVRVLFDEIRRLFGEPALGRAVLCTEGQRRR